MRLHVQHDGSLKATDFFAPFDAASLDDWDADFASGGVTGLPEEYFGTATSRTSRSPSARTATSICSTATTSAGSPRARGSDKVVQRVGPYGGVWSRPGVWPGEGGWVYIPTASGGNSCGGLLRQPARLPLRPSGSGAPTLSLQATSSEAFGFSSSAPVITSEGTTSGSALVWTCGRQTAAAKAPSCARMTRCPSTANPCCAGAPRSARGRSSPLPASAPGAFTWAPATDTYLASARRSPPR